MGVSFDVTFPTASDVYGIPERATAMSLKPTQAHEDAELGMVRRFEQRGIARGKAVGRTVQIVQSRRVRIPR